MKHSILKILSFIIYFRMKVHEWQHNIIFWWENRASPRKKQHHYSTISWTLSLFSPSDIRWNWEKNIGTIYQKIVSSFKTFYILLKIFCVHVSHHDMHCLFSFWELFCRLCSLSFLFPLMNIYIYFFLFSAHIFPYATR